jgi:hypothetical protein
VLFRKPGDVLTADRAKSLAKHGGEKFLVPEEQRQLRAVIAYSRPEGTRMLIEYTRGAVAVENVTQAVARDILAEALVHAHRLPVIGHIHDEIFVEGDFRGPLHEAMLKPLVWAEGLPIAAKTHHTERYWK